MSRSDRALIPKRPTRAFNALVLQTYPSLLPEEKLGILQTADLRRKWHSLDDRRVCVLCHRTITGRQIQVRREAGGTFSLHCPTDNCASIPSDWFYQGNACSAAKAVTSRSSEASMWE